MRLLIVVMLGAFVAQTAEYLPIGLLPQIASDLAVSEGSVGALVTGYAWIAAATAVPLTLACATVERRTLFLALLAIMTFSNAMAAVSPNFMTLASMRVLTALTHGIFWSILANFAISVAPHEPQSRALAWAFAGISLAIVAGVPLATAIGQWLGWRAAFAAFAVLGSLIIAAGRYQLPPQPVRATVRKMTLPHGAIGLYPVVAVTIAIITAHFCGYTYIIPLLSKVGHMSDPDIPLLLLVFGIAGAGGTVVAGRFGRRPALLALFSAIEVVTALLLMAEGPPIFPLACLVMILWGMAISMLIIGLQGWVIELAPTQADAASSLYVAAFNLGIGTGAMVGGFVLEGWGHATVLWTAIAIGIAACSAMASLIAQSVPAPHPSKHE